MAELRIGAEQFRRQLTDLLNRTCYGQDHIIIERHGTPLAAVIPFDLYEALMAANIPEKLAKRKQTEQIEEISDLAVALDSILENDSPIDEQQLATVTYDEAMLREAATPYYAGSAVTSLPLHGTLTLEEAAMYLKLPVEVVTNQADQGNLPGRKINNTWRFLRTAVDNWLRNSDGRQILLQQAGVFADDASLAELRAEIYAERGRPEIESPEIE